MHQIVGTWMLVRASAKDASGNPLPEPYGGKGIGRVVFTADGRMQAVVCDGRQEMPPGIARDYSSYAGNYIFDGKTLTTRVDAASDPSRVGGDQVRGVRFEGELVVLTPPPRQSAGTAEYRELTWQRISDE
jgi:hypothetical protein